MTRSKSRAQVNFKDAANVDVIHNLQDKINESGLDIDLKLYDKNIFNDFSKENKIIKVNYNSELQVSNLN